MGNLASTGGWVLGERAGGELFNSAEVLALDGAAEAAVEQAASASFRPCCDNSTLFQDCNHGSALLGLYQLAAAQGADVAELLRIGKLVNSYWFSREYLAAALYFRVIEDTEWVLIYLHKEQMLDNVEQRYPARHYVMVDDKLRILAATKKVWGDRLTTVFPRQGHYALDSGNIAAYPAADLTLERIGDLVNDELPVLLRAVLAGHSEER